MRVTALSALSLLAAILSALGSYSYGEPVKQRGISFSLPYPCGGGRNAKTVDIRKLCLADSFRSGLKVVLVSRKANCSAQTGETFTCDAHEPFKATHLTGTENCFAQDGKKIYLVAVFGVDPSAVHEVEPKTDKSPLSKKLELKARKIASSAYQDLTPPDHPVRDVADSPPDAFSVGNTSFLLLKCTDEFLNQDGLPVLVHNSKAFLLEGSCAVSPFFFSVKEKLYVSYWATVACCGCGDSNFFVYDLSGKSPIPVYYNSNFSD